MDNQAAQHSMQAATDKGQEPDNSCGTPGQQTNDGLDAGQQLIGAQPVANTVQAPLVQLIVAPYVDQADPVPQHALQLVFSHGSHTTFQLILSQPGAQGSLPPVQLIVTQPIPWGVPPHALHLVITQQVAQGSLYQSLLHVDQPPEPQQIATPDRRRQPIVEGVVPQPIISPPVPQPISVPAAAEPVATPSVAQTVEQQPMEPSSQQQLRSLRSMIGLIANPDTGSETTFAVFIGLIALMTTAAAIFAIPPPNNTPEPSVPKAISLVNEALAPASSTSINKERFWGSISLFASNMLLFVSIILGALAAIWAYRRCEKLTVGKVLSGVLALFLIHFFAGVFKFAPGTFSLQSLKLFRA